MTTPAYTPLGSPVAKQNTVRPRDIIMVAAFLILMIQVSRLSPTQESLSASAVKSAVSVSTDGPHDFQCLASLPEWVNQRSPELFKQEVIEGSMGLTDKTQGHSYHHMYHRYLAPLARRVCDKDQNRKIRILEIGLGCSPSGGMRGAPGGSALAWHHLFPSSVFDLDLHIMEFDAQCANKWAATHRDIATVHTGDASSPVDLNRVVQESGGAPFDIIIDDASHLNEHQIKTFLEMIDRVALGGFYVIEDIHSACTAWKANTGAVETGLMVGGTSDCMVTATGEPTIYAKIVEWQKKLLMQHAPFPDVTHIDLCLQAAVIQKEIV